MTENNVIPFTPKRSRRRRRDTAADDTPAGVPLAQLIESWRLALQAANRSSDTIYAYTHTAQMFVDWLVEYGHPADSERVQAEHVRAFLVAQKDAGKAATSLACYHVYLGIFFNWIIAEGERTTASPVIREERPEVPKKTRRYLTPDEIRAMLATCRGNDFIARRDTAIIRMLADNGIRVGGLLSIRLDGVDLQKKTVTIVLKGGDEHVAPIGRKAAYALDRYLRVRATHSRAEHSPWLWLTRNSRSDRMSKSAVEQMIAVRARRAGIEGHVTPHMFRGTVAHTLLENEATEGDVMQILGWKTRRMIDHYAGDLAAERARRTHARLSPGDRI